MPIASFKLQKQKPKYMIEKNTLFVKLCDHFNIQKIKLYNLLSHIFYLLIIK